MTVGRAGARCVVVRNRCAAGRLVLTLLATALLGAGVAGPAEGASGGRVAVDSAGTAHFTWARSDGAWTIVQGRSRTAEGTLNAFQNVSLPGSNASSPQILAGPAGTALHYWTRRGTEPGTSVVEMRRRSADGSLSGVQTISAAGVELVVAAADPRGNAVFAWTRYVAGKLVVEVRRRAISGALSPVQRMSSSSPTYGVSQPRVAVDAAGNAVVAWRLNSSPAIIQMRRRAVDGTLTPIQNVTTSSASANEPAIGVDAGGNAVVAFRRALAAGNVVQVRRRGAAGGLSEIQDLSAPTPGYPIPEVAVSANDGAVVAWDQPTPSGLVLQARRRPTGGAWGSTRDISTDPGDVLFFRVATDADGDAVFAWIHGDQNEQVVQIRRRSAAGTLSPVETLSPAGGIVSDFALDLGVEPGGGSVATWMADVDGVTQLHARRRTATGEIGPVEIISY